MEALAEVGPGMYGRRKKKAGAELPTPTEELADLVRLCTAAHRQRCGGFLWLCYEAAKSKHDKGWKKAPRNGLMAVAMTAECARKLQVYWPKLWRGHLDVAFRFLFETEPEIAKELEAGFVYPPVGNYVTHLSGIEAGLERESTWDYRFVQEGTRKDPDEGRSEHRQLFRFTRKGKWLQPLATVVIPEEGDEDFRWFTHNPSPEARGAKCMHSATAACAAVSLSPSARVLRAHMDAHCLRADVPGGLGGHDHDPG